MRDVVMAQQPTQVLPSNAPPLRDSHIDHTAQRQALQEHSGNRQQLYHHHHHQQQQHHNHPHSLNIYEQHKLASTTANVATLGENAYSLASRQPAARAAYYPQSQVYYPRPSWPRGYQDRDADARARVAEGWQSLYNRFINCPKYKDYRGRQYKDGKIIDDQKWPENLEHAFFKALLYWPPMGRRKLMHKDKQRGRNELIADYIEAHTRIKRTRKQVSSHIQVLKPYVEHDERIMQWLSLKDHGPDPGRHVGSYNSSCTNGRLRSTYSASAQHMQGSAARVPTAAEVRQVRSHLDVFQPVEFKLFVQPSTRDSADDIEPLHIYSQSATSPLLADRHIADWTALRQDLPVLAERHARRPIECNVLAVEASLAMPLAPWRDREKIELAVILNCVSRRLLTAPKVYCSNSFYKNGEAVSLRDQHGSGELQLTRSESSGENGDARSETRLKFGSSFWANTLNPVSTLAKSIMSSAQKDATECARIRRNVDADMRSITAIQEISVPTQGDILEPVLIMYWTFCLSSNEVGSTTWRRLHIPPTASQAAALKAADAAAATGSAVDTPFNFNAPVESVSCGASTQTGYAAPSLQSPFEYDNGSAAAQSPSTWATSISTSGSTHNTQQQSAPNSATEMLSADSSFDLVPQNNMMMFDPAIGVEMLDSSAFNFDVNGTGSGAGNGSAMDCSFVSSAGAMADQVGDEQAMAYTAATQGWASNGYTDSYNAGEWQDFNAAPNNNVHVNTYAAYATGGATQGNDFAYATNFDAAASYAGTVVGHNALADGRQAYAGAMQDVNRAKQREWSGNGYTIAGSS